MPLRWLPWAKWDADGSPLHMQLAAGGQGFSSRSWRACGFRVDSLTEPDPEEAKTIQDAQNKVNQAQGSAKVQGNTDTSAVADQMAKPYLSAANQVESSWMTAQRQILYGQKWFGAAMRQMWSGIAMSAIESIEKIGFHFAKKEIMMVAQHSAAQTEQTAITASGSAQGITIQRTEDAATGLSAAKTAAKNTYKVVSGWPVVGPILAPIAAGAAFAAVEAFQDGGVVKGASHMAVPAVVHGGERVLNFAQTQRFEQMVNSSGNSGGNGEVHLHLGSNTFHGHGAEDFRSTLDRHEDALVSKLKSLHRNGKIKLANS